MSRHWIKYDVLNICEIEIEEEDIFPKKWIISVTLAETDWIETSL